MMTVRDILPQTYTAPAARPAQTAAASTPKDTVDIDWSGNRPAHRDVKKLVRGAAFVVGAAGIGKAAYDLITSPSIEIGLVKASLSLAGTAVAIVGLDLVSGLGHHAGDNYGPKRSFNHTRWHTDVDHANYCLVGVSNKALDKINFWPKWEKLIFNVTGMKPTSWQVNDYQGYANGTVDKSTLQANQTRAGLLQ